MLFFTTAIHYCYDDVNGAWGDLMLVRATTLTILTIIIITTISIIFITITATMNILTIIYSESRLPFSIIARPTLAGHQLVDFLLAARKDVRWSSVEVHSPR